MASEYERWQLGQWRWRTDLRWAGQVAPRRIVVGQLPRLAD